MTDKSNAPWRNEELLREKYLHENLSCDEIAEELGCSGRTVDKYRRRYDIVPYYKNAEWLDDKFNKQDLNISQVANRANCSRSTITKWLDKLDVREEKDKPADYAIEKPWQNPDKLREYYHGKELSAKRVADKFGCSPQTVRHWLIQHGIERRNAGFCTLPQESRPDSFRRYPTIQSDGATILEHRFVAFACGKMTFEELCDPNIVVHHRTNIPWDNRPENLEAMTRSEHMSIHGKGDYKPETL